MKEPTTILELLRDTTAEVVYHRRRMYPHHEKLWRVSDRFGRIVYDGDSEAQAVAALLGEKEVEA